jgi:hypothetical protein
MTMMTLDDDTIRRDAAAEPAPLTRPPLSLSDNQMDAVMAAAGPLEPHDRSRFLEDVASALRYHGELGDGIVARVCADVQRRYLVPPDLSRGKDYSRWR